MFVRKKINSSGSTSVQIIVKTRGKYKVVKTIGCSSNEQDYKSFFIWANKRLKDQMVNLDCLYPNKILLQKKYFLPLEIRAFVLLVQNLHRLRHRIEAHICISFTAYCIYKELERLLYKEKSSLSLKKAAELTHSMYQITYMLPESKHSKSQLLKMDDLQAEHYQIILKIFSGVPQRKTGSFHS